MILIAYDGSDDARAAIADAARLFPGDTAVILTVWERFVQVAARSGLALGVPSGGEVSKIDSATEQEAKETAESGARIAGEGGLTPRPQTTELTTTVAEAILREAEEANVKAIVMGTRGLGRVKAALLGSVSNAVLHHADRPVVIVPAPDVAAVRAAHLGAVTATCTEHEVGGR